MKILALHIGPGRICAAIAESNLRGLELTGVEDYPLGDGEAPNPFAGRDFDRVIATFPADRAVYRFLELPFSDRRRLSQAVGPALEEHVPLSLDTSEVAFDTCGNGRVLAIMADDGAVTDHTDRVAALSAPAEILSWAPTATLAAYRAAFAAGGGRFQTDTVTFVDLSHDGATIGSQRGGDLDGLRVVGRCDDATLVRNVAFGVRALDPDVPMVLLGGPRAVELGAALTEELAGMEVRTLSDDPPLPGPAGRGWQTAAPAVGLLVEMAGRTQPPRITLGHGDSGGLGEMRSVLAPLARWAVAAALLFTIAGVVDYARLSKHARALEQHADEIAAQALPAGSAGPGAQLKMEMRLRELAARNAESGGSAGATPLAVLIAVSRAVPKNLDVTFEEFVHSASTVRISGKAAGFDGVRKLGDVLREAGPFADVEIKDVHASVSGEGVDFQMTLSLS